MRRFALTIAVITTLAAWANLGFAGTISITEVATETTPTLGTDALGQAASTNISALSCGGGQRDAL